MEDRSLGDDVEMMELPRVALRRVRANMMDATMDCVHFFFAFKHTPRSIIIYNR
jgi:hypothetical protein